MQTLNQRAFTGAAVAQKATSKRTSRSAVVVRASSEAVDRRSALGLMAAAAALAGAKPSEAAYGDQARVFAGRITNSSGFVPYAGEGYALLLPSKWNPSKERDFPNVILRYEDNFDAVNNIVVIQEKVGKNSIDELGSPDKFLSEHAFLLGETAAFKGQTQSEGGFAPNKVAAASVLDVQEVTDKNGKKYYKYDILNRTADGDEGGRHQLIAATVSKGDLFICKVQIGDKRWFKGAKNEAQGAINSFTVA